MLDHALEVAARRYDLEQKQAEFHADLMKLPVEELQKIASTGEIKLAYGEPCGPGGQGNWLDNFKGTPFFEQAIGLEQEDLQAQMAQQQAQQVNRQKDQQGWDQMDSIRLKKRLLELQKARNEAQVLSGGGGPPNQTGSGAGPGAEAQGAGALGPVAPEGQQEGSGDTNKMGSVTKEAISIAKVRQVGAAASRAAGGPANQLVRSTRAQHRVSEAIDRNYSIGDKLHAAGKRDAGSKRHELAESLMYGKEAGVKLGKLELRQPQTDAELEQYLSPEEKERLKMASAIKKAMDPALMGSLQRTAGAGPALKGQLSNVGQKLTGGAAGQVKSMARKGTLIQNAPAAAAPTQGHFQADPFAKAAFAVTEEGHKFDAEYNRMKARHEAEEMGLLQAYNAMGSSQRMGSFLRALRFGGPDDLIDPRHREYTAAKHEKGENAYNIFGGAMTPSSHERNGSTLQYGEMAPPKEYKKKHAAVEGADAWGRMMARMDMAKVARAREVFATGDTLGRVMAKTSGVLGQVGQWAMKHPSQAGAIAGGTLGAAHGLLKEDGSIGQAVGEGIVGAGAGHALGGVGGRMMKGKNFGDALSGYATNTDRKLRVFGAKASNEAAKLSDKLKGTLAEAKAPEQALSGPQVQAAE